MLFIVCLVLGMDRQRFSCSFGKGSKGSSRKAGAGLGRKDLGLCRGLPGPVAEERLKRDCEPGRLLTSQSQDPCGALDIPASGLAFCTKSPTLLHIWTIPAVTVCVFYVLLCPIETTNVIETFFLRRIFQARKIIFLRKVTERRERDGAIKSFSILALLFFFLSLSIYLQKSSST